MIDIRMKQLIACWCTVIAAMSIPASAWATRIAVVDMATIYRNFREVARSQAFLKEKKDEYQNIIDREKYNLKEEELALEQIQEDLRTNRERYSAAELQAKENEQRRLVASWQQKFQAMRTRFEEYKQELEELEQREFRKIRTQVDQAIATVAGRQRITMVLEQQWVYYGSTMDITDQVLQELEGAR